MLKQFLQVMCPVNIVICMFAAFTCFISGHPDAGFGFITGFCGWLVAWAALNGAYED